MFLSLKIILFSVIMEFTKLRTNNHTEMVLKGVERRNVI